MKFTEERLEQAIIELLGKEGYPHICGEAIVRASEDVLIKSDLREFLAKRYQSEGITAYEIEQIIHKLEYLPASDLYDTNKAIMNGVKCSLIIYLLRVFMKGNYKMISLMKITWKFERKRDSIHYFF